MLALFSWLIAVHTPIVGSHPRPQSVQRLVSASPALTEIVCSMGVCNKLVGVSRFCDVPEEVKALPKVGGFVDPSVEATIALKPDLVLLTTNGANKGYTEALDKKGVAWIAFRDDQLSDFAIIVKTLGDAVGGDTEGTIKRFDADLALLATRPKLAGQKLLVVYGHAPLVVAGPETFGAELLHRIGAGNAYTGTKRYPTIDLETLVRMKPDTIIDVDMRAGGKSDTAYYAPVRTMLKDCKLMFVPDPALLRLGPRLPAAMLALRLGVR